MAWVFLIFVFFLFLLFLCIAFSALRFIAPISLILFPMLVIAFIVFLVRKHSKTDCDDPYRDNNTYH